MSDTDRHSPTRQGRPPHPPSERDASGERRHALSLAVLVWIAPIAWFVHLSAGMVLGPASCRLGSELALHVLSVSTLTAALGGAALLAVRHGTSDAASRFVVRMGLGFAALSILAIVVAAVAAVPIDGCEL